MPLIEYYRMKGTLVEVDGTKPIDEVSTDLMAALSSKVS
jgi:adenylate kinase family enzyme